MSEPTSDALFGVDGTQSPEPLPNPWTGLGRGTWAPELPPILLPPIPDTSGLRAAIIAALGDEPTGPVDQDRVEAPERPAEPDDSSAPKSGGSSAPESGGSSARQSSGPPAPSVGPNAQAVGLQVPGRPLTSTGASSSPLAPPLFPSAPSRSRRTGGPRDRPPMAAAFRRPVPPADLRRRLSRDSPGMPGSSVANLALGAVLFASFIIVAVLVYYIIIGFLESMSRLFP